jgi:hypothetical protein
MRDMFFILPFELSAWFIESKVHSLFIFLELAGCSPLLCLTIYSPSRMDNFIMVCSKNNKNHTLKKPRMKMWNKKENLNKKYHHCSPTPRTTTSTRLEDPSTTWATSPTPSAAPHLTCHKIVINIVNLGAPRTTCQHHSDLPSRFART